jgi:hypothetical protein
MQETHSKLSPSTAKRWMNCPGSVKLIESAPPQKPNIYAAEGSVAHAVAASMLDRADSVIDLEIVQPNYADPNRNIENDWCTYDVDEFHIIATDEMYAYAGVYADFVSDLEDEWGVEAQIEQRVVVDEELGLYGTADCILYVPYNRLYVIDFKYGAGNKVSAENNEQLMYYALGALLTLPEEERLDVPEVEMIIVQPRGIGQPIERFVMKTQDLLAWNMSLLTAVYKTQKEDAELIPGDWCKYCPAAPICPALKQTSMELTKTVFENELDSSNSPPKLTNDQLIEVLDKADLIRDWLKAVEKYAFNKLEAKEEVRGYCLKPRYGNRKWKDEKEAIRYFKDCNFDEDELFNTVFKSPTQLENFMKTDKNFKSELERKEFLEDISKRVERPFNGYALTKGTAQIDTAKDAFDTVELKANWENFPKKSGSYLNANITINSKGLISPC